jgi:3-oxoacyl-[acyl-carrier-protein] synthase-1
MAEAGAFICGIGMLTAVGGCAAQTAASVRAGINGYQESSICNKRFEPMTLAIVPEEVLPPLAEELTGAAGLTARQARMLRLAGPALEEALAPLPRGPSPPLFLAVPESVPKRLPAVTETFMNHLAIQTTRRFDPATSRLFPNGRAGGFAAITAAIERLAQARQDYVLVGGVDSYLDLYLLGMLDIDDRVLANGVTDGFAPGEGAAFLLLGSERARQTLGLDEATFVHLPGLASEAGHRYSDQPYKGEGLAEAVSLALAANPSGPIRTVLAGLNGENFGAKEWGVAAIRNQPALDPDFRFEHPADCFGDTGAAVAPILIALAAIGLRKGTLAGPCLAWSSSEGPERGAACIDLKSIGRP